MAPPTQRPSLLVIVGPTASGKSELALRVAKRYGGEIIAADSRTIYKGMDIGTAKPTSQQQAEVPHWGLNLVEPGQAYSAARFKEHALGKIDEITRRGRLPILVGGTGLYVDGVVFDFNFPPPPAFGERESLEKLSSKELQNLVEEKKYPMPENRHNRRHLVRVIERQGKQGEKQQMPKPGTLIIGLMPDEEQLKKRIATRAVEIFDKGVITETQKLSAKYGEKALLSTAGIVYKICLRLLRKEIDKDEAIWLFQTADWQYARRQRTWFKRNYHITWYPNSKQAYQAVTKILNT
ncbi:MAG: tRNA (adenosine(37)-N6)-dimethylallyltransferase MiaA [Candidatus Saccharimonadales bacterium]